MHVDIMGSTSQTDSKLRMWLSCLLSLVLFRPDTGMLEQLGQRGKQRHTPELDGIRGYACLSIVVLHCITGITTSEMGRLAQAIQSYT